MQTTPQTSKKQPALESDGDKFFNSWTTVRRLRIIALFQFYFFRNRNQCISKWKNMTLNVCYEH